LLAVARRLAFSEKDENEDRVALYEILLRSFAAGVTELHIWAPSFVADVSERPIASPVARHQNRRTKRITTLRHTGLELNDALSRNLLELLDGTRDLATLVEALAAIVQAGKATLEADGEPVTDPAKIREMIAKELPFCAQRSRTLCRSDWLARPNLPTRNRHGANAERAHGGPPADTVSLRLMTQKLNTATSGSGRRRCKCWSITCYSEFGTSFQLGFVFS
jgi:hypothetical protein